jgi:hypothetical protein
MSKRNPQINVRLPEEIKERIQQRAMLNGVSVNSEIVSMLDIAMGNSFTPTAPVSAEEARDIAEKSNIQLRDAILDQVFYEIRKESVKGYRSLLVEIDSKCVDFEDENIKSEVINPILNELYELGFKASYKLWNIYIEF